MQKETKSLLLKRSRERELVCEILKELLVVQRNQIYLQEACSSMTAYCMEILGYSEDETYFRMQAMSALRAMPTLESKIKNGELKLTVIARAHSAIRRTEKVRKVSREECAMIFESLSGATVREAAKKIATALPESVENIEKIRPVSEELTKIEFYADNDLMNDIERLRELLAHKNYDGRLDGLFREVTKIALKELDPQNSDADVHVSKRQTRYISKGARRVTWDRAGSRCEYVDPVTGKRCSCRYGLQIDHIQRFSDGGSNDPRNLRLLCGPHNRWRERSQANQ